MLKSGESTVGKTLAFSLALHMVPWVPPGVIFEIRVSNELGYELGVSLGYHWI